MARLGITAASTMVAVITATLWSSPHQTIASAQEGSNRAELWVEPGVRDLAAGVGRDHRRPGADERYEVLERDTRGFSITYKVKDAQGGEWNVKIGPEAPTEVVTSRIVWALGYHQVPSYFVERWIAVEDGREATRGGGRFRPRDAGVESKGTWLWQNNPFVGTRELNGLLVLMMMLNSSDLKDENNELFEVTDGPTEGARRWYVVKDLGASLGETGWFDPRRGFIDAFEQEKFITGVNGRFVKFGFHGRHKDLLEKITVDDVRWLCERVSRLTDRQLQDAFHVAGYTDEITNRYIARIRQKVAEGLALK